MFDRVKSNAMNLINDYSVNDFPVQVHMIQEIIHNYGYRMHQVEEIEEPCIIGGSVLFFPKFKTYSEFRYCITHELGHIVLHDCISGYSEITYKEEIEADVFALYFTMPPSLFDTDARSHNIWQLSEIYGVPVESVKMRLEILDSKAS